MYRGGKLLWYMVFTGNFHGESGRDHHVLYKESDSRWKKYSIHTNSIRTLALPQQVATQAC